MIHDTIMYFTNYVGRSVSIAGLERSGSRPAILIAGKSQSNDGALLKIVMVTKGGRHAHVSCRW